MRTKQYIYTPTQTSGLPFGIDVAPEQLKDLPLRIRAVAAHRRPEPFGAELVVADEEGFYVVDDLRCGAMTCGG